MRCCQWTRQSILSSLQGSSSQTVLPFAVVEATFVSFFRFRRRVPTQIKNMIQALFLYNKCRIRTSTITEGADCVISSAISVPNEGGLTEATFLRMLPQAKSSLYLHSTTFPVEILRKISVQSFPTEKLGGRNSLLLLEALLSPDRSWTRPQSPEQSHARRPSRIQTRCGNDVLSSSK